MLKKIFFFITLFTCTITIYAMDPTSLCKLRRTGPEANNSLITLPIEIQKTIIYYTFGGWQNSNKQFNQTATLYRILQCTCKAFASMDALVKLMDINDANKNILLIYAAQSGIPCLVQYAITKNATLDYVEKQSGRTPLSSAIRNGNYKCCVLLLTAGANVHKAEEDEAPFDPYIKGYTPPDHYQPIHLAAGRDNIQITQLLITHGADVNALTLHTEKQNPLFLAYMQTCFNRNMQTVELLEEHGAKMPEEYHHAFL